MSTFDIERQGIVYADRSGNGAGVCFGANPSNMTSSDWNRVTPSDTEILPRPFRALRVGTAGDITVRLLNGNLKTINEVQAGETISIQGVAVMATNTTPTEVEVLY